MSRCWKGLWDTGIFCSSLFPTLRPQQESERKGTIPLEGFYFCFSFVTCYLCAKALKCAQLSRQLSNLHDSIFTNCFQLVVLLSNSSFQASQSLTQLLDSSQDESSKIIDHCSSVVNWVNEQLKKCQELPSIVNGMWVLWTGCEWVRYQDQTDAFEVCDSQKNRIQPDQEE